MSPGILSYKHMLRSTEFAWCFEKRKKRYDDDSEDEDEDPMSRTQQMLILLRYSYASSWLLLGLAFCVAHSAGLFRDWILE